MDLVQQVATHLEIDEAKAERAIGAILMALRSSVDRATFDRVTQALPHSEHLMGRALMGGGRTGELMGFVGPAGLSAALAAAGFDTADLPRLGRIVLDHLQPVIGDSNAERFLAAVPALKG